MYPVVILFASPLTVSRLLFYSLMAHKDKNQFENPPK